MQLRLVTHALSRSRVGPYQLQPAIASVHAEAGRVEDTDWPQILALYGLLERIAPNPMVALNRAVALGMARGPLAGLELLATIDTDGPLADHHRVDAVCAHLLEMTGAGRAARRRSSSPMSQRHRRTSFERGADTPQSPC